VSISVLIGEKTRVVLMVEDDGLPNALSSSPPSELGPLAPARRGAGISPLDSS
jgi:hypothetical protein